MTLGQQIQMLRKGRGLSQEGLGEALCVSRQAVSQWESDSSVPEVEKLVALSKFFGVSVGSLLQVEELPCAPIQTEGDGAFDAPPFEKPDGGGGAAPRSRKRLAHIVTGIVALAAVAVIGTLWSRTGSLERQVESLNEQILFIQREVEAVKTEAPELRLDPGAPLVAGLDFSGYRPPDGTYAVFTLNLTAAQSVEGMKVHFLVTRSGGGTVSQEAITATGTHYMATITVPHWTGASTISAVFEAGEQKYAQELVEVDSLTESAMTYTNLWDS